VADRCPALQRACELDQIRGHRRRLRTRCGVQAASANGRSSQGSAGAIPSAQISAYVANNALNTAGTCPADAAASIPSSGSALFPDALEAWSQLSRTGYPALCRIIILEMHRGTDLQEDAVPAVGTEPECGVHAAAIARQGPDNFLTHIWWDKNWACYPTTPIKMFAMLIFGKEEGGNLVALFLILFFLPGHFFGPERHGKRRHGERLY